MGFPIPVVLALLLTFNELIGGFLIGCGFLTRLLAASLALGMSGAVHTSVRLEARLAQSGALPYYLQCIDVDRSRRIFARSSSKAQQIRRRIVARIEGYRRGIGATVKRGAPLRLNISGSPQIFFI